MKLNILWTILVFISLCSWAYAFSAVTDFGIAFCLLLTLAGAFSAHIAFSREQDNKKKE